MSSNTTDPSDSNSSDVEFMSHPRQVFDELFDQMTALMESVGRQYADQSGFDPAYHATRTTKGKWTIAYESDSGVSWSRFTKTSRRQKDKKTYFVSDYGRPSMHAVLDLIGEFEEFYQQAITSGYLEDPCPDEEFSLQNTTIGTLVWELEGALEDVRQTATLEDLKAAILNHDEDAVKTLLVSDEDDSKSVYKMLTYWKDNKPQDTEIDIPVENSTIMLVRATRYYQPEDKYYPVGYVVGYDDTDDPFFIHRLNSTKRLRDEDHEWTITELREEMGFEVDLSEYGDEESEIQFDRVYRAQGDLSLQRGCLEERRETYENSLYWDERETQQKAYHDEWIESVAPTHPDVSYTSATGKKYSQKLQINIRTSTDTEGLKTLQSELSIDEDSVREIQNEHEEWKQLTAKRRKIAIEEVLRQQFRNWVEPYLPLDEIETTVEEKMRENWDTTRQINLVVGNHLCILSDATVHPNSNPRIVPIEVLVPEECELFIIHDEHQQKKFKLSQGSYNFDFLDRHRNA